MSDDSGQPSTGPSNGPGSGDPKDRPPDRSHHSELPHTSFSRTFDAVIRRIGSAISWIWLVLVAVIVLNVTLRYVFGEGRIEFEEIQWHIYSFGFLIGLSYCLESDDHVRVDVLYDKFGLTTKAWVEFLGILLFLCPFIILVIWFAVPFVAYSASINEISEAPGGLPGRWAIKSVLLIGFILLLGATVSRLSRASAYLFGTPSPLPQQDNEQGG